MSSVDAPSHPLMEIVFKGSKGAAKSAPIQFLRRQEIPLTGLDYRKKVDTLGD